MTALRWFLAGMVAVRTVDLFVDHGLGTLLVFTVGAVYMLVLIFGGLGRLDVAARLYVPPSTACRGDRRRTGAGGHSSSVHLLHDPPAPRG